MDELKIYKPSGLAMLLVKRFIDKHHGEPLSIILHREDLERMVDKAINLTYQRAEQAQGEDGET